MKIRKGFVTNSSSTNFIFGFKGDTIDDLVKAIQNHPDAFDLIYEGGWKEPIYYKCNADDVTKAIVKVFSKEPEKYDFMKLQIRDPSEVIKEEEKSFADNKEWEKEYEKDNPSYHFNDDYIEKMYNKKILYLKEIAERGMSVLEIEFGDNHGHIEGGDLGMAMDYEGRYIEIFSDDLIVVTEQNR